MALRGTIYIVLFLAAVLSSISPRVSAGEVPAKAPIIVLMTDYGTRDFYTGALKGVIYSVCPEAIVVDITHEVTPFDIREGALTLLLAAREFPPGTVFVGIVDPGVGTARKPIVAETGNGDFFVGPDNGLFTMAIREFGLKRVYQITNPAWMHGGKISSSFHGRDIFGPAAARLASGSPPGEAGPPLSEWVSFPIRDPVIEGKKITTEVLFVDRYGNIQLNVGAHLLQSLGIHRGGDVAVTIEGKERLCKLVGTYGDVKEGDLLLLQASTGFMEVAVNLGSAAKVFGAKVGAPAVIEKR